MHRLLLGYGSNGSNHGAPKDSFHSTGAQIRITFLWNLELEMLRIFKMMKNHIQLMIKLIIQPYSMDSNMSDCRKIDSNILYQVIST